MRPALLLVPALAATVAALLLLSGGPADEEVPPLAPGGREAPAPPPPRRDPPARGSLEGPGEASARPPGPAWPVVPSDRIPRGSLEVLPAGPDGTPVSPDGVDVALERLGAGFWTEPLGQRDLATGVWTFKDLPYGRVRVRVLGEHVLEAVREADVPAGASARVEVPCERGGAIAYRASLESGGAPASVRLRLRPAGSKTPLAVLRRLDPNVRLVRAVRAPEADQGAEGLLFGIPPGRYELDATSAEGATQTQVVEVQAGATVVLELLFRY